MKTVFGLVNKVVVFLSETPLHLLFSHQVMVLRFRGRRTGRLCHTGQLLPRCKDWWESCTPIFERLVEKPVVRALSKLR